MQKIDKSHNSPWSLGPKIQLESLNSPMMDQQKEQSACRNNRDGLPPRIKKNKCLWG